VVVAVEALAETRIKITTSEIKIITGATRRKARTFSKSQASNKAATAYNPPPKYYETNKYRMIQVARAIRSQFRNPCFKAIF